MPYLARYTFRSCSAVGEWEASTIAIVLPPPFVVLRSVSPYAERRSAGVSASCEGCGFPSGLPFASVSTCAWERAAPLCAGPGQTGLFDSAHAGLSRIDRAKAAAVSTLSRVDALP